MILARKGVVKPRPIHKKSELSFNPSERSGKKEVSVEDASFLWNKFDCCVQGWSVLYGGLRIKSTLIVSECFFRVKVEDIMLKSCPYCGKIHDKKYNCPKKPVRQRQDNRQGKFRSTYKWTKKAQAVKRRDGYLCQVCVRGLYHPERRYETEGLEVHHIQTVASCYEKRLDGYNLLTLCERHHKMADAGKIPAKELQMIAAEQEEK